MSMEIFKPDDPRKDAVSATPAERRTDPRISPYKQQLAEVREKIRIHREKEARAAADAKAEGK